MLRACPLKYGSSWNKSLPYVEFLYNNNYQNIIEIALCEALYGSVDTRISQGLAVAAHGFGKGKYQEGE
jgi:hypothetical protein